MSDDPPVEATALSFAVLEAVRELDGAGVSEIARHLDRSKSGVYKHLQTLTDCGYLVTVDGAYHVGLPLWTLGASARERFPVEAGRAAVDSLAASIDHVVSLVVYENETAAAAYQQRPPGTERSELAVGDRCPLHASAAGKAVLAHLPADARERVIDDLDLQAYTDETITDADALREELAAVRDRRTGFDRGEQSPDQRGVAAPIVADGTPVGAVAVSGTADELDGRRLEEEIPGLVVSASRSVENTL